MKSILRLALPLLAIFLAQKGMQIVDTVMMGWIGPYALAAGALGGTIFMTVLVFCMGTLSALGVSIARAKGAQNTAEIQSFLQNGIYLALLLSLPCMLLIWIAPSILLFAHVDPQVVFNTKLFLHALLWGLPGFLLFLIFREFTAVFSVARIVMIVTLCSIPLTFLLNYVLVFGKMGFPPLGVEGIGLAGAVVMWIMFFSIYFFCRKKRPLSVYLQFKAKGYDGQKIRELLRIGSPSGAILVLDVGTFLIAACMISLMSVNTLAAHQIAIQCVSVLFSIPFSLSMATALRVSHALGEENLTEVYQAIRWGIGMGASICGLIGLGLFFFPEQVVKLFLRSHVTDYHHLVSIASSFLIIAAFFQVLDAVQVIANGALRGLKDTFIPMLLCVISYFVVGVGSAYYLGFHTSLQAKGVWYGLTFGISSAGILLGLRLYQQLRLKRSQPISRVLS
jgi:MATE family multidrug resistance protein